MGFLYTKIFRIAHRHAKVIDTLHKNVKLNDKPQQNTSPEAVQTSNQLRVPLMGNLSASQRSLRTMITLNKGSTAVKTVKCRSNPQYGKRSLQSRNSITGYLRIFHSFRCTALSDSVSEMSDNEFSSQDEEGNENVFSKNIISNNNCSRSNNNTFSTAVTPKTVRRRATRHNSVVKATKTVAGVCGCFLVCWLPVSILAIGSTKTFININAVAHVLIVDLLPVLNSTVNPFIYSLMNSTYRKAFRRAIRDAKNVLQTQYLGIFGK